MTRDEKNTRVMNELFQRFGERLDTRQFADDISMSDIPYMLDALFRFMDERRYFKPEKEQD